MSGRKASQTVTKYAGIQIQTSALGLQVPLGWGTFRSRCNLMDYLDFKSTGQSSKSGGKGGSQTTGYSYTATIILAVCEGQIDGIDMVYVDSNIYTNGGGPTSGQNVPTSGGGLTGPHGATYALQQANLNMNTGAVGQAVWSYLTSNHPSHAIGYSGLAIVYQSNYALDGGAAPPNHSFEVIRTTGFGPITTGSGSADIDPSLMVADFFQNPRTGVPQWPASGLLGSMTQYQDYCLAAGLLLSPLIDSERAASDLLTEVFLATNSTCVWSEGVLKVIPYGDTTLTGNGKTYTPPSAAVYALNDDDFIQDSRGSPVLQIDIEDQTDAYNVVQLEYLDRTNQYNMAIALASDAANVAQYLARRQDPTTVHVICDPTVAALSAQLYLQRTLYVRGQQKFKLGWQYALLEPGDIVTLTDAGVGYSAYPARIIQIDEDNKNTFSVITEDYLGGIGNTPIYGAQTGVGTLAAQNVDPGGVEANLALYSQDFTNAVYTDVNVTVTGAAATDPYGTSTGCALAATSTNGLHSVSQDVASVFGGANYTVSVFLAPNTRKVALVRLSDTGETNGIEITIDVSAGSVVTAPSAFGTAVLTGWSFSEYLTTGWYQVTLTGQFPSITTLRSKVYLLNDAGAMTWAGDGTHGLYAWGLQLRQGVAAGAYAKTTSAIAGPYLFNPPSVLTQGQQGELWAAVAGGPFFGGCNVWVSADGSSYQQVGTTNGSARFGLATTTFPSNSDPDTTDNLGVDLGRSGGELTGAAQTVADNGGTMCLIDQELITYEAATLTNPNHYTLGTYIRRGFSGTPIAAHSIGAPFVRLDQNVFQFPYLAVSSGATIYVKFQPFNLWGRNTADLANCNPYTVLAGDLGAAAPGSGAWSAVGGVLANMSQSIPALIITGASDNPAATGVAFFYRLTGLTAWSSAGIHSPLTTVYDITTVAPVQTYDVGVAYQVNGVIGAITEIASAITTGAVSGAGSTAPGDVIFSGSAGEGSITVPAGSYAHVDIVLKGGDGGGTQSVTHGIINQLYKGGGGGVATYAGLSVTPGTTVIAWSLGSRGSNGTAPSNATAGSASTVTSPAMTANGGAGATTTANGAGGTATGGTTNTTGATGSISTTSGGGGTITITARA